VYPWSAACSNPNSSACKSAEAGDIWGHFISHVDVINNGGASNQTCIFNVDPTDIDPCIAVLTR
jgi:hypothetical protein